MATPLHNLHTQCNPYPDSNGIEHGAGAHSPHRACSHRAPPGQSNPEEEEQSWRDHAPWHKRYERPVIIKTLCVGLTPNT